MTRSGNFRTDVNPILWATGWKWLYVFVGAPIIGIFALLQIENGFGTFVGLVGFFAGPPFAIVGLVYVHLNKGEVIDGGTGTVKDQATKIARLDDDGTETFSLVTEAGNSLPLLPKPDRKVATLVVDDSLLLVHDSAVVRLPDLSWSVGESTNEFYYDQISRVNYNPNENQEGGEFWVNLADGHGESWQTTTDGTNALNAVQDRIRAFKSG